MSENWTTLDKMDSLRVTNALCDYENADRTHCERARELRDAIKTCRDAFETVTLPFDSRDEAVIWCALNYRRARTDGAERRRYRELMKGF